MKGASNPQRLTIGPALAEQYEVLRSAALGEPLPPEARSGLGLFLRRGLWGWARVLSISEKPEPATPSSVAISTAPPRLKAVIQVFAGMAANTSQRRAR